MTPLGSDPARLELGNMAARMWTAFVTDLDPNGHGGMFPSSFYDSKRRVVVSNNGIMVNSLWYPPLAEIQPV